MPNKFLKRGVCSWRLLRKLPNIQRCSGTSFIPIYNYYCPSNHKVAFNDLRSYCTERQWIVSSQYSDVEVPNVSFSEYIFNMQEKYGGRIALRSAETNLTLTHADLRSTCLQVASGLHKIGVSKGDMVALFVPNCPEFVVSFISSTYLGATVTSINCAYTAQEIRKQLQDSQSTLVIAHFLLYGELKKALQDCPKVRNVIIIGKEVEGTTSFHKLLSDDGKALPQKVDINPSEDLLVLPYSSGTTGLPKGVMLTHTNIIANLQQLLHSDLCRTPRNSIGEFCPEKLMGVIPFFHIYGMVTCMLLSLSLGAEMVTMFRFDYEQYINVLKQHKPSILHVVPPIVTFLTNPEANVPNDVLKDVGLIVCGAAPLGPALLDQLFNKFKTAYEFVEGYGMTEASPVTHMSPKNGFMRGSCGTAIPNTHAKIVDTKTHETLGPNDGPGELCVKGPQVMKGYFNNPEATKDTLSSDGWLHTGDIATMDAERNVFIVDRLKELIKVKGFQVAPAELEDLLRKHPKIADVAVIGVPDDRAGELPKAYVVPSEGIKLDPQDVMDFIKDRVAPHKELAGGVSFVDNIPKSSTGKILRKDLKMQEGIL